MTKGPLRRPQMYVRRRSDPTDLRTTPSSEATPMHFDTEEDWDRFALNPVVNGEQMRTLVDPEEHWEHMTHSIDISGYDYSKEEMRASKEEEARTPAGSGHYVHGAGIYDWMARGDRQRQPIEVIVNPGEEGYGQGEGHHRAASKAAVQADTGEQRLLKFQARQGYAGSTAGTRYSDYEDEYEPTPVPSSQRTTGRKMTPSNQPKLGARSSRAESFTWNPPPTWMVRGIERAKAQRLQMNAEGGE